MKEDLLKVPESPQAFYIPEFAATVKTEELAGDLVALLMGCYKATNKPTKSRLIEHRYGIEGDKVRLLVRLARRKGIHIVGSRDGYYVDESEGGIEKIRENLIGRIMSMAKTLKLLGVRNGYKIQMDLRFTKDNKETCYNVRHL